MKNSNDESIRNKILAAIVMLLIGILITLAGGLIDTPNRVIIPPQEYTDVVVEENTYGAAVFLFTIGLSLVASAVATLITLVSLGKRESNEVSTKWRLVNIHNSLPSNAISNAKDSIDMMVFSDFSFTVNKKKNKKGLTIRVLAYSQRKHFNEINNANFRVKQSISNLQLKHKCDIKYLHNPFSFCYFRIDSRLFVIKTFGQDEICYEYKEGGNGWKVLTELFNSTWNGSNAVDNPPTYYGISRRNSILKHLEEYAKEMLPNASSKVSGIVAFYKDGERITDYTYNQELRRDNRGTRVNRKTDAKDALGYMNRTSQKALLFDFRYDKIYSKNTYDNVEEKEGREIDSETNTEYFLGGDKNSKFDLLLVAPIWSTANNNDEIIASITFEFYESPLLLKDKIDLTKNEVNDAIIKLLDSISQCAKALEIWRIDKPSNYIYIDSINEEEKERY